VLRALLSVHLFPRFAFPAVLLLVVAGCVSARRITEPGAVALAPSQQLLIYHRTEVLRWHAVVVTRDSVTGIPYKMAITCQDCRRRMARTEVDSIRLRDTSGRTRVLVGAAILAMVAGDVMMMAQPDH
jgi:hypothetical protein